MTLTALARALPRVGAALALAAVAGCATTQPAVDRHSAVRVVHRRDNACERGGGIPNRAAVNPRVKITRWALHINLHVR